MPSCAAKAYWDIPMAVLREAAGRCPQLQRVLSRFEKKLRNLPGAQRPSEWSRDFSGLLEAFGLARRQRP